MNIFPSDVPPVIPESQAPPVNRLRWWVHLALVGSYVLLVGVLGWTRRASRIAALSSSVRGLLIVCGMELLFFGGVIAIAFVLSRPSRDDLLLRWRGGFWPVPLGIGYSLALRIAVIMLTMLVVTALVICHVATVESVRQYVVSNKPDLEALVDLTAMRNNPAYFWLTLTLVSFVVAGLREELWRSAFLAGLRALWPRRFASRSGQIAGVGVAAIIFGFGHLRMGVLAVAVTTVLGFGLGVIMVVHRSIWPAVIAHGMFDATTLGFIPFLADKLPHAPS